MATRRMVWIKIEHSGLFCPICLHILFLSPTQSGMKHKHKIQTQTQNTKYETQYTNIVVPSVSTFSSYLPHNLG